MPLREDILAPIPGENPSGIDVRYDNNLQVYDKIQEARRKDDELAQGDWQHERKVANYPLVIKLAQETIATVSKDLQLAAWLTEALLQTQGFSGLKEGLGLCHSLMTTFWDTLYPIIEDGDRELRARPLAWIGYALEMPVKSTPIVGSGYDWLKYKESRDLGYEESAKTDKDKKARAKALTDGKLAPEVFDKAFAETGKPFYQQAEKDLDACLAELKSLNTYCDEVFEDDAPPFGKLESALQQVRLTVHSLLEKKRETDPDPVVLTEPEPEEGSAAGEVDETGAAVPSSQSGGFAAPTNQRDALAVIASAAAFLRKQDPLSPAPYLMLRGLRWGELRSASSAKDGSLLEAPSTDLRQQIKRLALAKKWKELLDTAEQAMGMPCSRAWLDLQRLVVGACTALGAEYEPIAQAVSSELRVLLHDLPWLLDATLLDDTPAANAETRAWLEQLGSDSNRSNGKSAPDLEEGAAVPALNGHNGSGSWLEQAADPYLLAKEALKAGQGEKAFTIMRQEIGRQRSGRGRFQRTMQLIELCGAAGKDTIAQPLLEDIATAIETHKLEAWEDQEMVAAVLSRLIKMSKKIQGSAADKQKLFERICRLDPVLALSME